jgi:DNA-binding winged helix-turn-helix (wHTH) protein/serine/threonine protein kinase
VGTLYRYRFGDVSWDQGRGTLTIRGEPVAVEPRPLAVLDALLQQPGVVVTKAELLAALWQRDESSISDNALANAVSKLRKALGENGDQWICTVPGVGYRFDARIEKVALTTRGAWAAVLRAGEPVPGRDGFVLERALGSGPDSEVWLAHQPGAPEGSSRVFKFCSDADRLAALKREFTLCRLLREGLGPREDFAEVLDCNFATAPYWLECRYGGLSWPEWLAEHPEVLKWPSLDRLALFLPLARSVAAAHSVGVLHKDLKPSNVLIAPAEADGSPGWQTRLTDFGSGRVLDAADLARLGITEMGLTVTRGVMADSGSGTLFYLAPELFVGQAPTVRSDLYALGLMLYQWLCGDFRRPMAPGWEDDIADPLLREDIAAATRNQPEQRLANVAEWVQRLERIDDRRLARAREVVAAERAARDAALLARQRTRRPWVWALGVSLVLGLGTSLWFQQESRQALAQAQAQAARADAINLFLNRDLLQSADLSRINKGDKSLTLVALLQRASDKAGERFRDQPETEASVRHQLAQIFQNMSALAQAQAEWERVIALLEPQRAADDPALLAPRLQLARLSAVQSRFDVAAQLLARAERDAGPTGLGRGDELTYLAERTLFAISSLRHEGAAAAPHGERALALLDALKPDDLPARAAMRRELADHFYRQNEPAKARALLEVVLKPPYGSEALGDVGWARLRVELARVQAAEGLADESVANYLQARDRIVALLGPDEYVAVTATAALASIYMEQGRFAQALAESQRAHASLLRSLGPDHQSTRIAGMNLALSTLQSGQAAAALKEFDSARPWAVQTFGKADAAMVQAIDFYRAQAMNDLGMPNQASALLQPLQPQALAQLSPAPDWGPRLQAQRGRSLSMQGRHTEARALLGPAVAEMTALGTAAWIRRPFETALTISNARAVGHLASPPAPSSASPGS